MKSTKTCDVENSLVWGIVDGRDGTKAIKIVLETFDPLFELPPNTPLWNAVTNTLTTELKMLFSKNHIVLGENPSLLNSSEEDFVLIDKETYYIQDRRCVYRKKEFEFYLTDFEPILLLHKCIEDYIHIRQQQDKRSIEDSVKLIGTDITHFGKKLNEAREKDIPMEELVLDLCVDEMGMTRNQALKTLALIMASLLERNAEFAESDEDIGYIR